MVCVTDKKPTMRTIADACGCSRNTVSLALQNDSRVVAERRQKIKDVAQSLGYRPDPKLAQVMGNIAKQTKQHLSKIGVLIPEDFKRPDPWKDHSYLQASYDGISEQMIERGYESDYFWLGAPQMSPSRMKNILLTRGIEGLIVLSYAKVPAVIDFDFSKFAAVVIGRALSQPRLDAVGEDLYNDLETAVLNIRSRGYRRIGLALDSGFSARSRHCWEAAFQFYQVNLPRSERVPLCIYSRANTAPLEGWVHQHNPDCIIGVSETTYPDLLNLGFSFPETAGFVTLIQDVKYSGLAGMVFQHKRISAKAVDIVDEKLRFRERGLPENPELVLFAGHWIDGDSLIIR